MRAIRWMWAALLISVFSGHAMAWQLAQITRYDATDFPGNDIDDMVGRARSFDDCAQRCRADDRCGAFTYNLNNRTCIPKSSGESPQRNSRAVSGVVSRASPGYGGGNVRGVTRYDATDFPGSDIDGMSGGARSYEDCAQRCLSDGRCGAFTFNLNNGNCIPKAGAGSSERNDRAVSGVVNRGGDRPGFGAASSCNVGGTRRCSGCSTSCGPSQRPVCIAAVESPGGACLREAECRCASN
jgi:PAN domain